MTSKIETQLAILKDLQSHGNIRRAARNLGITARTIHRWRVNDSAFDMMVVKAVKDFKRD